MMNIKILFTCFLMLKISYNLWNLKTESHLIFHGPVFRRKFLYTTKKRKQPKTPRPSKGHQESQGPASQEGKHTFSTKRSLNHTNKVLKMHESTARVFIFTKNIPISLIFMNPLLHYLQLLRQTGATRSQIIIFRKTDELSYTRICQLERNRRERVFETWLAWEGESKGVPKHIIATWRCSELPREHQLSTEHVTVEGSRADLCQALLFNLLSSMEQTLHSWAWPKV